MTAKQVGRPRKGSLYWMKSGWRGADVVSEAIQLRVGLDVDLVRGALKLDANKTDDARTWVLDAGVKRALAAWVKLRNLETGALLFTDETGAWFNPPEKESNNAQ